MIRRLQLKIVIATLGTLLVVFGAVLLVLNLSVYQTSVKRAEDFMASVVDNDGFSFPPRSTLNTGRDGYRPGPPGNPEMVRAGRFFYAKTDQDGNIIELNLEMMFDFPRSDAQGFVSSALDSHKEKGDIGDFSFLAAEKPYGHILVFAERSIEISLLDQLTTTSLWVAGAVSLVLLGLTAFFSRWMVRPIKAAFDRQRRFVSDASHELKTPLTIISTNVDVLENEIGENQRLEHIKEQSQRMNGLIHDLLTLAKAGEGQAGTVMGEFDISSAALSTVLEFESRAFEEGKQYSYDIAENVAYTGDEKQVKRLIGILIDNAVQYSGDQGLINVSLCKEGGHVCVSVFNTGIGIPDDERGKVFERFYRVDESRTRETGGYGVGLSIAQAIVEGHKGKIAISGEYGKWIRFDVTL